MQIDLDKKKKYLLACSYGPDSMALFDQLLKGGYYFEVGHVNYGMRGEESERETANLDQYCQQKGVKTHILRLNGKTIKGNFQGVARKMRYDFFDKIIHENKLDILLTAHHLDDFLETYLMQEKSKRKSFYFGIRKKVVLDGITVVRPLLNYYKNDLHNYCENNAIPYAIDSSNLGLKYTRNKIRHELLSHMSLEKKEEIRRSIIEKNTALEILEIKVSKMIKENTFTIDCYAKLCEEEKEYLLYYLFLKSGIPTRFTKGRYMNLNAFILNQNTSSIVKISDDIAVVKFEGKIKFFKLNDYAPYEYIIREPMHFECSHFVVHLNKENAVPYFTKEQYPLIIRSAQDNDKYRIKNYSKNIKRLFLDMKLPRHLRLIWPVVINKFGEIIYVPRYRRTYTPRENALFEINI